MLASRKAMQESYTVFPLRNGEKTRRVRATGFGRRKNRSSFSDWRAGNLHFLFLIVVFSFLFAGSTKSISGQTQSVRSSEIREYSEQASKALKDNQLDVAAHAYVAILQIDPVNVDARANL